MVFAGPSWSAIPIMQLCQICLNISPEALVAERPDTLFNGRAVTASGYLHHEYEYLDISARDCKLCKILLDSLGDTKNLKPHRKPHTVILMADTHRSDHSAPSRVAGMIARVKNSSLTAHFQVYAWPGQ